MGQGIRDQPADGVDRLPRGFLIGAIVASCDVVLWVILLAPAVERNGTLVDDFVIQQQDGISSVPNAPSPAATSSLAIAQHVVDRIEIAV